MPICGLSVAALRAEILVRCLSANYMGIDYLTPRQLSAPQKRNVMKVKPHVESPELDAIAGFEMPYPTQDWYRRTHAALTSNPLPNSLLTLTIDEKHDWVKTFTGLTLGPLAESQIACWYHAKNICAVERELVLSVQKRALDSPQDEPVDGKFQNSQLINCGHDCKIAFEYQAYVAAYRRSWDYLGQAVGAYFQQEVSSIDNFRSPLLHQKIYESPRGKAAPSIVDVVLGLMEVAFIDGVNIFAPEQSHTDAYLWRRWRNMFTGRLKVRNTATGMEVGLIAGDDELKSLCQDYRDFSGYDKLFHLGENLSTRSFHLARRIYDAYYLMGIIRACNEP